MAIASPSANTSSQSRSTARMPRGANRRATARPAAYQDLWNPTGDAAPPVDRKLLKPASANVPVRPDFLDWAVDVPDTAVRRAGPGAGGAAEAGR